MPADEPPEADPPEEFDEFTLVLLTRPRNAPALTEEESDKLQRQHLGHLERLKQQGALIASGPFQEQPDESWRGLSLYRVPLEEARRLAESDPAVRRGRLAITAFRWLTRKGEIRRSP
jgi:uncharacterized protein YciI